MSKLDALRQMRESKAKRRRGISPSALVAVDLEGKTVKGKVVLKKQSKTGLKIKAKFNGVASHKFHIYLTTLRKYSA